MVMLALGRPMPLKQKLSTGKSVTPSSAESETPAGAVDFRTASLTGWRRGSGAPQLAFEIALISAISAGGETLMHTTIERRQAIAVFCAKRTTACASS